MLQIYVPALLILGFLGPSHNLAPTIILHVQEAIYVYTVYIYIYIYICFCYNITISICYYCYWCIYCIIYMYNVYE